ncbi:hypothetical protein [Streptomyces sp. NPDC057280]|uniref:hypothetical protein n=1 Tax=Streptomyces sp. NPDC057280 TaxID=3346081 RepID=UPI003641653D
MESQPAVFTVCTLFGFFICVCTQSPESPAGHGGQLRQPEEIWGLLTGSWSMPSVNTINIAATLLLATVLVALLRSAGAPPSTRTKWIDGAARQLFPVVVIKRAVYRCTDTYSRGARRADSARALAGAVRVTSRTVNRMHRTSQRLPVRSHRRRQLKHHAGLVVAALRQAEARIDVEGAAAIPELARLLMKIADRYVQGHLGALLDDEELTGLEAVRDWEALRIAAFVVITVGSAATVSQIGLSESTRDYAIGACGILASVLFFGPRARRGLDLLSQIRGGQG